MTGRNIRLHLRADFVQRQLMRQPTPPKSAAATRVRTAVEQFHRRVRGGLCKNSSALFRLGNCHNASK